MCLRRGDAERGQVGIGTLIVFTAMVIVAMLAAGVFLETSDFLQAKGGQTSEEAADRVTSRLSPVTVAGNVTANRDDNRPKSGDDALADGTVNTVKITAERGPGGEFIDVRNTTVLWTGPNESVALKYGGNESHAPGRGSGNGFGASTTSGADATSGLSPVDTSDTDDGDSPPASELDGDTDPHLTYHVFSPNSADNTTLSSDGELVSIYINVAAVESGTADDRRRADLDPMTGGQTARVVFVTPSGGRTEIKLVVPQSLGPNDIIEL